MTKAEGENRFRAASLTISSRLATGPTGDLGGEALAAFLAQLGAERIGHEIVPDALDLIAERLRYWADEAACDLIVTTGGTGFAPTDVTPEATEAVIERRAPGMAEAMRSASAAHTKHWPLSRATAGIRGGTLIINFPGSPKSIAECAEALLPSLPHALSLLRDLPTEH